MKTLFLSTLILLFVSLQFADAQTYANSVNFTNGDGTVTTTYEVRANILYYHVHCELPDSIVSCLDNGYDAENQAQFWLSIPNHPEINGGFEYCFTINDYWESSDPNIQMSFDEQLNAYDFTMQVDVTGVSDTDLANTDFQTGLCLAVPDGNGSYYFKEQLESLTGLFREP